MKTTIQVILSIIIVIIVDTIPQILSFYKFKSELPSRVSDSNFSLLHNNIRSLERNLENFQVHLLNELNFEFSIIGVSETKIFSGKEMDFNPSLLGYVFEYVPTQSSSWKYGLSRLMTL